MYKRTLQEIFNAVIDAEHYPYKNGYYCSSNFMCDALRYAKLKGTITEEEMQRALKSIRSYINKLYTSVLRYDEGKNVPALSSVWRVVGIVDENLPFDEVWNKLLVCYKDWTNRPYIHRKLKGKKV